MNSIQNIFQDILKNKYFIGVVTILGVLFTALARPPLPPMIIHYFDKPIVKIIVYALVVLLMTQNLQVAIVLAVGFYVLMNMIHEQKISEGFMDALQEEGFFSQETDPESEPESTLDEINTPITIPETNSIIESEHEPENNQEFESESESKNDPKSNLQHNPELDSTSE